MYDDAQAHRVRTLLAAKQTREKSVNSFNRCGPNASTRSEVLESASTYLPTYLLTRLSTYLPTQPRGSSKDAGTRSAEVPAVTVRDNGSRRLLFDRAPASAAPMPRIPIFVLKFINAPMNNSSGSRARRRPPIPLTFPLWNESLQRYKLKKKEISVYRLDFIQSE
ncbi:hypothetical protein EVAR_79104_1 [Eumeta japonica]|uniref:Uncharacterized protein n=1 Tax=Eumeta variegata TaxID=151549 RepID=A0A4C1WZP2_EUMVA|nr:hypothetical protein EVAR_79104_1 [Eumeta japonica]